MTDREVEKHGKYLRALRKRLSQVETRERNAREQLATLYKKKQLIVQVTGLEHEQIDGLIRDQEVELQTHLNCRYEIEDELDSAYIRENADEISNQIAKDIANAAANLATGGLISGIDVTGTENDGE